MVRSALIISIINNGKRQPWLPFAIVDKKGRFNKPMTKMLELNERKLLLSFV